MKTLIALTLAGALTLSAIAAATSISSTQAKEKKPMELGSFTLCLLVKDIKASKEFYEKLGFKQTRGSLEQNWVVLMNGTTTIGLFHGMFEKNMLTFNPGWDWKKEPLKDFQDVREIQRALKASGLTLLTEADEAKDGPAFFTLADPDGNPILVDQHEPKPKR